MLNAIYRLANSLVAAVFGSAMVYCVWDKARVFIDSQPDHIVGIGGLLVFLSFVVIAWTAIDVKAPRAL